MEPKQRNPASDIKSPTEQSPTYLPTVHSHLRMSNPTPSLPQTNKPFTFPPTYSFPPFFTPQPNSNTRHSQLQKWSSLIQSWCRHHRIYRLSLIEAIESPLFHNTTLRKRINLSEARTILDWMAKPEEEGGGGRRAEWIDGSNRTVAWIWWRRPEEWAAVLADWVCYLSWMSWVLFGLGWGKC